MAVLKQKVNMWVYNERNDTGFIIYMFGYRIYLSNEQFIFAVSGLVLLVLLSLLSCCICCYCLCCRGEKDEDKEGQKKERIPLGGRRKKKWREPLSYVSSYFDSYGNRY